MRERKRGAIINVASTAAFQPVPYMATYAATKAFVLSFTEALWEENRAYNIKRDGLVSGRDGDEFFEAAGVKKPPFRVAANRGRSGGHAPCVDSKRGQRPYHLRLDQLRA